MPTYSCTVAEGQLSQSQKAAIAKAITDIHCRVAVAPTYFAQVIFNEVKPGNHFVAGRPLDHKTVFVYGTIRTGRPADVKKALLKELTAALAEAAGLPSTQVWIYLTELEGRQMVEFGQILPAPGEEDAWAAALPADIRAFMEGKGR
jgi:phenylpyruvate tautomerase PptA (4-oxalocrotonate tautomerase family)